MVKLENVIFNNGKETIDVFTDEAIRLVSSDGLSAEAVLNMQTISGYDGGIFVSAQMPVRNPTFAFRFRSSDVEYQQIRLNRIFRPKTKGTLTIINRLGIVKLDYIVESLLIPPNAFPLIAQLSLQCPDPYFYAPQETNVVVSGLRSMFKLPFQFPDDFFKITKATTSAFCNITNRGEEKTGITIEFSAETEVVNPALVNVLTSEAAKLNFTMQAGDRITITTDKGNKAITLLRDGETTNLMNSKAYPFTFIQLNTGTTTFKKEADSGVNSLFVKVKFREKYASFTEENI